MAYMIADRRPDPVEKVFFDQRPRFRDPQQIHINVKETAKTYVIEAALPGLRKEDIKGQQTGQQAATGKEQGKKTADSDTKYHRREISTKFRPRQIRLPQDANTQDIKAEYTDGILTIIALKDPKKRNKKNEIKVQ